MKSPSPALHPPQKYKDRGILHPKRSTDDRSDQSSVKSTDSSSYPSPCASPSPPSSGKVGHPQAVGKSGFTAHLMYIVIQNYKAWTLVTVACVLITTT